MRKFTFSVVLLAFTTIASAQQKLFISFYNQENLFDTLDDPNKNDNEFLPAGKNQWNTEKYLNKIDHMGKVLASMNNNQGPDLVGMCEVENHRVLADLVTSENVKKFRYSFVHFDSPDDRSIDNALVYKTTKFILVSSAVYPVTLADNPEFKTRDILVVKLRATNKSDLVLVVNHFPSRLGGQKESEHKRIRAAQVLRHIFDSIRSVDPNQAVIAMGDFNDEPTDKSIDSVVQAKGDMQADIYNAMMPLKLAGQGSLQYRKEWNMLDQVMMTKNVSTCTAKFCYVANSAAVYKPEWMQETEEKYKGSPLRTFGGSKYLNGYSDHFPVYVIIELKK